MKQITVVKYSKDEETNDNDKKLTSFAIEKNMGVRSTQSKRKETETLIDGKTTSQILEVYRVGGVDCNFEHFLMRIRHRKTNKYLT